jgi:hypothetical protein
MRVNCARAAEESFPCVVRLEYGGEHLTRIDRETARDIYTSPDGL